MQCHLSFGEGHGNPLQYSCLENPMDKGPGRLQSMGSWGVGHDWATSLLLFTFMHWWRKWKPTPVFLLGESQRWRILVGCHLWSCTKLDTNELLSRSSSSSSIWFWINDSRIPNLKMRELRLLKFNYLAKRKTSCK